MREIITISAADAATAEAQLAMEISSRPGTSAQVLHRSECDIARLNIVPASDVNGTSGFAEKTDASTVSVIVVEFS